MPRLTAALFASILAISLAACSSDDDDTVKAGGSSSSRADQALLGPTKAATGTPVKVGLINAEGGATIDLPETGDAAEAAASYANEHLGGLAGHPIEVVRCADKSDNASAAACANRLVEERVAVVVIAGAEPSADQIVPIVVGAGIPYVAATGGAVSELTTVGTFFWNGGALAVLGGQAQFAREHDIESINFFVLDLPTVTGALTAIGKPVFDKAGVELRVTPVPAGTADTTSLVAAAVAKHPDAVAVIADPALCRSLLSALATSSATVPKLVNEGCVDKSVIDALGPDALDGLTVFRTADATTENQEARLYRAVMQRYAPKVESIIAVGGYQSMLGLVRAVNAGGLTGDPTPAAITAAIRRAKDVPLPAGHGISFSCDRSAVPNPLLKGVLCSSAGVVTTMKDGKDHDPRVVDGAPLFAA